MLCSFSAASDNIERTSPQLLVHQVFGVPSTGSSMSALLFSRQRVELKKLNVPDDLTQF